MVTNSAQSILAEARQRGIHLELVDSRLIVRHRRGAPVEDIRGLVESNRPQVIGLLEQERLLEYAAHLPGMPVVHFTLWETEDVDGDVAFLQRLVDTLREYPGGNRVIATIRGIDGCKHLVEWRALASRQLRRSIGDLLRRRAVGATSGIGRTGTGCVALAIRRGRRRRSGETAG